MNIYDNGFRNAQRNYDKQEQPDYEYNLCENCGQGEDVCDNCIDGNKFKEVV